MRVALVSMDQAWEDKSKNRKIVSDSVAVAKSQNADLIIFPEMTLTGFSFNKRLVPEKVKGSDTVSFFKETSLINKISIVFGFVGIGSGKSKPKNLMAFSNSVGKTRIVYAKRRLFSLAGEHKFCSPGKKAGEVVLNGASFGASICYDLRFPELFRQKPNVLHGSINIANWPSKRLDHWKTLLKARAIENQFFMIGVNRIGTDGLGLDYQESSLIFDPLGVSVEPTNNINQTKIYDLDLPLTKRIRCEFPFLSDK
jgi:omega-amidase